MAEDGTGVSSEENQSGAGVDFLQDPNYWINRWQRVLGEHEADVEGKKEHDEKWNPLSATNVGKLNVILSTINSMQSVRDNSLINKINQRGGMDQQNKVGGWKYDNNEGRFKKLLGIKNVSDYTQTDADTSKVKEGDLNKFLDEGIKEPKKKVEKKVDPKVKESANNMEKNAVKNQKKKALKEIDTGLLESGESKEYDNNPIVKKPKPSFKEVDGKMIQIVK